MRTLEDVRQFFDTRLLPGGLSELEQRRKDVLYRLWITYGVITAIVALGVFYFVSTSYEKGAVYAVVLGLATISIAHRLLTRQYRSRFKEVVIGPLVAFFDPSLRYNRDECIPQPKFEQSKIFLHGIDRYNGDDFVGGAVGRTAVQFSELHAEYKTTTTDSKGHQHTQWHTILKGLFFIADFNKHFSGRTVVLPDQAERMLGGIGKFLQSKNVSRDPLVSLDDPEFEKEFVVYSSDQIEARYILSSSLMRRILDFKEKTGRKISLAFVQSNVFIALAYTKDLFEPNVFKTVLDFSVVEEYFTDLKTALDIVEDLNLNTRIWSKE